MDIEDDEVKLMIAVVSVVGIMLTIVLLLENLNVTGMSVIRLVPPVILTQDEADLIVSKLDNILDEYSKNI